MQITLTDNVYDVYINVTRNNYSKYMYSGYRSESLQGHWRTTRELGYLVSHSIKMHCHQCVIYPYDSYRILSNDIGI